MIVTAAAIACFGFYLANIPLKCALVFSTRPQAALSGGASIFEGRFALRRALRKKTGGGKFSLPSPALLRPALHAGRYLFKHTHLERISLQGVVSTADAASTALLAGLGSMLHNACLPLGGAVQLRLQPDFSAQGSDLELTGMISVRLGHIILAALIFALEYGKERYLKWKADIRLKASCTPRLKTSGT